MKHHASANWGNERKNPMAGIRPANPDANRNAVRVLLSGPETEALAAVRHHRENSKWLDLADEIEFAKPVPRAAVMTLIRNMRKQLTERGAA